MPFPDSLGGSALRARNIALAAAGAALIARRLNTDAVDTGGSMGLVRLPLPGTAVVSEDVRRRLLEAGTDAPTHPLAGALWLRLSAFAYNDLSDYERLADIVARVIREASA